MHAASLHRGGPLGSPAARQPSARIAIAASALATFPYVAFNVGLIIFHEGSIVHMSKFEWAIFTALSSLVLWLGSATILAVSAIVTQNNAWHSTSLALLVFVGIEGMILPGSWTGLFDPVEYGFGSWVFAVGVLSTVSVLILKWMATPEVTLS